MAINIQNNLITPRERHVRTELWRDKIYHIPFNPYDFPKNDGSGQFMPLPKRFSEIIAEFRKFIDEQKSQEKTKEEKQQAKDRIKEVYSEIKEIIQWEIEALEVEEYDEELVEEIIYHPNGDKEIKIITKEEWQKNKLKRLKHLQLGLEQKTASQFKRFNQEILNSEEVTELLEEWTEQRKIARDNKNACFIEEDNADSLVFCYQPPKGDFHALDDFLWYRNNIWYETVKGSWQRINHENAIVVAKRSYFIHKYHNFFLKGANGIFHNHPLTKSNNEICQCPSFLESTDVIEFVSDWQPEYQLWKSKSWFDGGVKTVKLTNSKGEYPVFHTLDLKKVDARSVERNLTDGTFFLLPKIYNNHILDTKIHHLKFFSAASQAPLKEWLDNYQANRGQANEHLLKKINVNFLWNSKVIYTAILDDFDFDGAGNPVLKLEIRCNPAEGLYRFESKKILFRYSEDLEFTLEKDKLASIGTDLLQKFTGIGLSEATRNYLHDISKKDKSQKEERAWERKSKMVTTSAMAQTLLGTVPSLVDASHTRSDHTLAEFALRFDSNNFKIRLDYNRNQFNRYQMTKQLKRACNTVFNIKRIGNLFHKGYIKAIANIFEGDRDGYFASLLSRGVYFYEKHPKEYFEEGVKEWKDFKNEIAGGEVTGTKTTIQENYTSAIGRDDAVHVDDMSWVWKDSYCRPEEGGADLFKQLIDGMRQNIKFNDSNVWKFNGYTKAESSATLPRGVKYEWYMHAFSSGQKDSRAFRGLDDGAQVILKQDGADWELAFKGRVEITETVGNPNAVGGGSEIEEIVEKIPDMEDEKQTAGLESMEQTMQAEAEQQNQFDKELSEELQGQEELVDEKAKEDELEPEPQKTKDKQKQDEQAKEEGRQQEDEDDVERSNER